MSTDPAEDPDVRYTRRMHSVVSAARGFGYWAGSEHVTVDHLLLGLLKAGEGVGVRVLAQLGVEPDSLRARVPAEDSARRDVEPEPFGAESFMRNMERRQPPLFSGDARAVLELAAEEADAHIGTEHLLIALLRHGTEALGDLTVARVREEIERQLGEFVRGRVVPVDVARADELIATRRVSLPPEIRELGERIALLRRQKEVAVDASEFDAAGRIRTAEKALMRRRAAAVETWAAELDVLALVEEVEALWTEVDRLRGLIGS